MKTIGLTIAIFLAAAGMSFGQTPSLMKFFGQLENMNDRVSQVISSGDHKAIEGIYTEIAALYDRQPSEVKAAAAPMIGGVWYNIACMRSLQNNTGGAIEALAKAIELGWNDYSHTISDPDLNSVRNSPQFKEIVSKIR